VERDLHSLKGAAMATDALRTGVPLRGSRAIFRGGLIVLAVPQALIGLWALFAPRGWFDTFPGAGHHWLPAYGAYNEHLATDVGGTFVALGLLLLGAAVFLERRLVQVALVAYLAFEIPHFIYHLGADDALSNGDQGASAVTLALTVVLAVALLVLTRRSPAAPTRSDAVGGASGSRVGSPSGPLARFAGWYTRRRYGSNLTPVSVYGHHPRLLVGYAGFETAVERSHLVDDRVKALGELKAAAMVGCEWCMDFGSGLGIRHGVSERQLRELPRYRDSEAFSELERDVLDYATAMTRTPAEVTEEHFDRLRSHFTDAQIVELSTAIAIENFRGRFNHALGMDAQGFSEGAVCVVPERTPAGTGGVATSA
jgi:alkylhydroperoxidase family enzyme